MFPGFGGENFLCIQPLYISNIMTPLEVIDLIKEGNKLFRNKHDDGFFKKHQDKQNPIITMISCSDSRVQCNAILPEGINRIFFIRNIGNQISNAEGSVDYGVLHLKTPVLLIVGHSDCGAVKAWYQGYDSEPATIQRELNNMSPAFINEYDDSDEVSSIKKNLSYQIQVAMTKYADLISKKELAVVGAYYDFANDLDNGFGKLNIVSINGVKQ